MTEDNQAARAQRIAFGEVMAELGGGHTRDDVPDETTPFRTENGGWSSLALEQYLAGADEEGA